MPARTIDLMLGLWLFVSAFAWPRTPPEFTNAWLVGLACAAFSLVAMYSARARFVVTALSAWLVAAAFLLPHRLPSAAWNDALTGLALLALSLVPGTMYPRVRRHVAAGGRA